MLTFTYKPIYQIQVENPSGAPSEAVADVLCDLLQSEEWAAGIEANPLKFAKVFDKAMKDVGFADTATITCVNENVEVNELIENGDESAPSLGYRPRPRNYPDPFGVVFGDDDVIPGT